MDKIIKKIRLFWISLLGLLILTLLWLGIVPLGSITYTTDFSQPSYFIGKLSPVDRVDQLVGWGKKIIGEPIYFSLFTPRPFLKTKAAIVFKNPPALVELGVRSDKTTWSYNLKPIYSKLLEELALDKNTLKEGDLLLWQKNKKYNSIKDFFSSLPALNSILVYHYPLPNNYILAEESLLPTPQNFSLNLRGAYQFYTYSSGANIDLTFYFKDRNENSDSDPIVVNLYRGSDLITSGQLADVTNNQERALSLKTNNLSAGVYRLEIKVNNDIVTTRLITKQRKISFPGALWLVGNNQELYTDGQIITAQTINPASCQNILVEQKILALKETYHQYTLDSGDTRRQVKKIALTKNDLIISSDSVLSLTKDSFFDPTIRQLSALSKRDNLGADYVLANYQPVKKLGDNTFSQEVDFNLAKVYREKGKYSFMLSAPNVVANNNFSLLSLRFVLSEPSLWSLIRYRLGL